MPETEVIYYCDENGTAPVLEWLTKLSKKNRKAAEKCLVRIETLGQMGHELRRPIADYLRHGIYELRTRDGTVQYRVLYFFHGRNVAVLAHGLVKEKDVPETDIERAMERKRRFENAPEKHTYREGDANGNDN
jgi:phage-related protein